MQSEILTGIKEYAEREEGSESQKVQVQSFEDFFFSTSHFIPNMEIASSIKKYFSTFYVSASSSREVLRVLEVTE